MRNLPFRSELAASLIALLAACGSTEKAGPGGGDPDGGLPTGDDASLPDDAPGAPGTFSGPGDADGSGPHAGAIGTDSGGAPGRSAAPDAGPSPVASQDGGAGGDARGLEVDSRAAYCAGSGPPITVGDTLAGRSLCTGAVAELTFTHALCTCQDATIPGVFTTDSFDSTQGAYQPGQGGAPVGIDRNLAIAGVPNIGGSLTVTGPNGLAIASAGHVEGDLAVSGGVAFAGVGTVDRDFRAGGLVTAAGVVTVGRNVDVPSGGIVAGLFSAGGTISTAPFTLAPPCDCKPGDLLDIAGIVASGKQQNDNADIPLDPDALDAVVGVADITLPCGRFYLKQIAGAGVIHVHVEGRTALFVDGDIATAGVLDFDIGPAGELDVFVTGNLVPTGVTSFGNVNHPAAVRIYVAGKKDVLLTGVDQFVGNVYAPNANVYLTGVSDVYGSIFAGNFAAPGVTAIHYDRGVLDDGKECPPPPPACEGPCSPDAGTTAAPPDAGNPSGGPPSPDAGSPPPPPPAPPPSCQVCGSCNSGTACVAGSCGACGQDSDCCAPLVCNTGRCGELIIK